MKTFFAAFLLGLVFGQTATCPTSYAWSLVKNVPSMTTRTFIVHPEATTTTKLDVMFLFDTSGSMGSTLTSVKTSASAILNGIQASSGDAAYGVSDYRDFPISPFGGSSDHSFRLVQDITTSTAAVTTAFNSLVANGGGDGPESQLPALQNITEVTSWRSGATRIVIWFGDVYGHTGADSGYPWSGSVASVSSLLVAANIRVHPVTVRTPGLDGNSQLQATKIAAATGGQLFTSSTSSSNIVSAILSAVSAVVSSFVKFEPVADTSDCTGHISVTFDPASYTGVFLRNKTHTFTPKMTVHRNYCENCKITLKGLIDGNPVCSVVDPVTVSGCGTGGGDPHFCSHDGLCYTFNGIGSYVFAKSEDGFEVQVQNHAVNNNTAAISALGIRVPGNPDLILEWAGESSQHIKFLVNGEIQDPRDLSPAVVVSHAMFSQGGGQYDLKWPSIPELALRVKYVHRSSFSLTVPPRYRGKLSGLGGNGDGIAEWSEVSCGGQVLTADSTMKDVHGVLEQCWKVAEHDAIVKSSETQGIVYHPLFTTTFASQQEESAAEKVCGGNKFCMYDAAVTGDLHYAHLTKMDFDGFTH